MSGISKLAYFIAAGTATVLAARRVKDLLPRAHIAERARAAANSGPCTHGHATVNGVRLHYAEAGSGPLVILLHGFPQCWYEWRYVIPRLAAHYRVVAPDLRGFNLSDKPPGIEPYAVEAVSQDILSLIEALGEKRAHLVGHDWGGSVAWYIGAHHPERVNKLVVINAPHPTAFIRELQRNPGQVLRSLYVAFFQLPVLPEALLRLTVRRSLPATAAVPGAFPEEALDVYENGVAQPGAATTMLNYYRAAARSAVALGADALPLISIPTLLIWGMKDQFLDPNLAEHLDPWVANLRVVKVDDSGHWVPEEKPGVVAEELIRHFGD